jgi:hypothetical protein
MPARRSLLSIQPRPLYPPLAWSSLIVDLNTHPSGRRHTGGRGRRGPAAWLLLRPGTLRHGLLSGGSNLLWGHLLFVGPMQHRSYPRHLLLDRHQSVREHLLHPDHAALLPGGSLHPPAVLQWAGATQPVLYGDLLWPGVLYWWGHLL